MEGHRANDAASPHTGRIEVWVLDDAKPVAEWVCNRANLDGATHIGDSGPRACAKFNEPCVSLRCVRYTPQRLWPRDARLTIWHQAKLKSTDVETNVERLVKVGQATKRLGRSEEHTSELQSQSNLVCRLLLE